MWSRVSNRRATAVLLTLAMVSVLLSAPAIACNETDSNKDASSAGKVVFSDVPAHHWAYSAVTWMASNNILNGFGNNLFRPDDPVTREQFAKIMVVALQIRLQSTYTPSFGDVSSSRWSFRYVEAAKPFLTGWRVGAGQKDVFRPYANAVREDMAVALVGALGLNAEIPDMIALDVFADKSGISANLQRHAAIAVKHGVINGVLKPDGTKVFDAQGILTRAQAAVLVFNALVKAGEKVTYDDDPTKVAYSDPSDAPSSRSAPELTAKVSGSDVVLEWSRITDTRLNGYKVVVSRYSPAPAYPQDGYFKWLTDSSHTSLSLRAGQSYSGGDVGGKLQTGVEYYVSVTAVYDGHAIMVPGNAVRVTLPAVSTELPAPTIKAASNGDGVLLSWTKITDAGLSGYKVVLSRGNSSPSYPDNGYLVWITGASNTSALVKAGCAYHGSNDFGGCLESGKTYYARITALFKDGRKSNSNVIQIKVP